MTHVTTMRFPLFTLCAAAQAATLVLVPFAGARALPVYHHRELAELYVAERGGIGVECCEIPGPDEFCTLLGALLEHRVPHILWDVASVPSAQQAQRVVDAWKTLVEE